MLQKQQQINCLMQISILMGVLICFTNGIQLDSLPSKQPRTTKYSSKPTHSISEQSSVSIYRVNGTNGATCILIRTDGILDITYQNNLHENVRASIFLPDYPDIKGDCTDEDISSITLSFMEFKLLMVFKKTPGGERWYVSNIELTYSSSNGILMHVDRPNLNVKLSTPVHNTLLFPTPVGKSYTCDESDIILYSRDELDKAGHTAKLNLRELRMQSFMYKKANTFGPPFHCSATGTYRDETAPLIVGTTLALFALGAVSAYGVWRYYKIKKVQYGAME